MPRLSQAIIVSADKEEVSKLIKFLNKNHVSRTVSFDTTSDAWEYLTSTRSKASIEFFFLNEKNLHLADELIKQIMCREDLSHIKVVMMADLEPDDLIPRLQNGAFSFLKRPFSEENLATIFNRLKMA